MKVFCRSTDGRHGDQSRSASLGKFNGTNTYEVFRRQSTQSVSATTGVVDPSCAFRDGACDFGTF